MRISILAILSILSGLAGGQSTDKALAFDAASIKPFVQGNGNRMFFFGGGRGGPGTSDPGRVSYPVITLKDLLINAYDVKDFQISGPEWLSTERFVVQATMPPETTKEQFRTMLQNLLAERFKVTLHRETKELAKYTLVVGKNGPKMKEAAQAPVVGERKDDAQPPPPPGPVSIKMGSDGFPIVPGSPGGRGGMFTMMTPFGTRLVAQGQTTQNLVERLSNLLSKPVTDGTALTAKYDFNLTFSMEGLNVGPRMIAPPPPDGGREGGRGARETPNVDPPQNLFDAIQSQLGLKLEAKKGAVDLIVIDHAEKVPTEN